MMSIRNWLFGVGLALAGFVPNCTSTDEEPGDETHFQECETQSDCADAGADLVCRDGYCKPPLPSGGTGGAPANGTCDDGTLVPEQGPVDRSCFTTAGNAGAVGLTNCRSYEQAGLATVDCGSGPAADGKEALIGWCSQEADVPATSFLGQSALRCVSDLVGDETTTLDPTRVCDPDLRTKLRACADELNPCEQPPICVEDGVYGCDEIRAACPALGESECRAGFDSRRHESRVEARDCILAASAGEDCVAAFYRCVWGI